MNFGSQHVYLYDSSDEEYIPDEELTRDLLASLSVTDKEPGHKEPGPKSRSLPSSYDTRRHRSHRSTTPPLCNEIPQLISSEDCEGSTTKYLSDMYSGEDEEEEKSGKSEQQLATCDPVEPSSGATAFSASATPSGATPSGALPLPQPPHGILKKKPGKRHFGGMVQWMSMSDTGSHKYLLKKYQPTLAEGISLPDLIPQLNRYHLLTDEENDVLLDGQLTHKERILKLLSFIEKKNVIAYHSFLQALQDETSHPPHQQLAAVMIRATDKQEHQERGVLSRQVDTNVVAVTFDTLSGPGGVHTGDVVVCANKQCTAVLSHLSKVNEGSTGDQKVWVCEFCGHKNEVDIVEEEMPTAEETTYLLTPPITAAPASTGAESATPTVAIEDSLLVFCIDTSGSMCVTTEVEGKVDLKSDEKLRRLSVSLKADIESQYMPRQSRNVTYISRLQSVQAAIDEQLTSLSKSHPSQRVALVSFSDEVCVIGDGRSVDVVVAGDKLSNVDELIKIGGDLSLPSSIRHSRDALAAKVSKLEEGGQTALGPALLLSILLAGHVPGSKVLVCTDGLANKGLGSLDETKDDEAFGAAQQFYKDLGEIAVEKGVTVSVVTIKGEECRIMELGQVADSTGGNVTRVDPSTVATEFSNIVSNPVIATNVTCKLILHDRLYFRTEEVKGNVMCVPVGNVTADTELSFDYGVKKTKSKQSQESQKADGEEVESTPPLMIDGKPHLPFQLQTEYTTVDGSVLARVISKVKPVTEDRVVAERDIDMDVIGCHVLRTSANLAAQGRFSEARTEAVASKRMMKRSLELSRDRNTVKKKSYARSMGSIGPLMKSLSTKWTASQSLPVTREKRKPSQSLPSERTRSQSMLKSAFERTKTTSVASTTRSKSLMADLPTVPRSVTLPATLPLTSREEAREQNRDTEDALAAEIFLQMRQSSRTFQD